jgi:hypothetical protein
MARNKQRPLIEVIQHSQQMKSAGHTHRLRSTMNATNDGQHAVVVCVVQFSWFHQSHNCHHRSSQLSTPSLFTAAIDQSETLRAALRPDQTASSDP